MLLVNVQMLYLLDYVPMGIGMYFLSKGIGMDIPFSSIMPIMATLSISFVLGYIAFFSPGGLGIREGTMFVMLKQFSNVEAALILPIAMRLRRDDNERSSERSRQHSEYQERPGIQR